MVAVHRCHVLLVGSSCEHPLCYPVSRGLPPELRCGPSESDGFGRGGGGCCRVPADLDALIARELRDHLEESRRRGFVLVRSA